MKTIGRKYRQAIETSLRRFVRNGDPVAYIGHYCKPDGCCQMCPKEGIKWHFILENLNSRSVMIVGSECINNYSRILSEWGYEPPKIFVPEFFRKRVHWIPENAVIYDNPTVMRFQADAERLIKQEAPNTDHFMFVKRAAKGSTVQTFGVDNYGNSYSMGEEEVPDDDPGDEYRGDWRVDVFGSIAEYEEWYESYEGPD